MDGSAFDRLSRAFVMAGSRRGLLGLLSGLTLFGFLHGSDVSEARPGRKAHRHHAQHQHRHATTRRRKDHRDTAQSEACIPTGQACPSKKARGKKRKKLGCNACCQGSFVTEASGKTVCGCQPNGGSCTTATASSCCSGFCNGTTCQAAPCSAALPCPPCQTCNSATGLCGPLPDGTTCNDGNACTQGATCQGGVCQSSCPTGCCAGGTCHIDDDAACGTGGGSCTTCHNPTPICVSGSCQPCSGANPCPACQTCSSGLCTATLAECQGRCDDGDGASVELCGQAAPCPDCSECANSFVCNGFCRGVVGPLGPGSYCGVGPTVELCDVNPCSVPNTMCCNGTDCQLICTGP